MGGEEAARAPFVTAAGGNVTATTTIPSDADVFIYDATNQMPHLDDVSNLEAILKRGGSVILTLSGGSKNLYAFENLTPVNFWAAESDRVVRLSTGAIAPADSPFASVLATPGFNLPGRFDLHLPYSTTETGQDRYEWERMGKGLLNTDWQVLLTTNQDGHLPLLVEGRCYAGHVFVFGGDLYAPELTNWSGYAGFVQELLKLATPQPAPSDSDVSGLKLSVAPYQPGFGDLQIDVSNPGSSEVHAVLSGKIRTLTRGTMNSFSQEITVPAGGSLPVSVPEGSPARQVSDALPSGDGALPFRRLSLGLSGLGRQKIDVQLEAVVDRTPAVTLAIDGENIRSFPDKNGWAAGGLNALTGQGMQLDRYSYFCGDTPKVTIHLGNGYHNIAPLAVASDLGFPENYSAQGLNDGAISYDSVRGKFPVTGYWSGREADTQQIKLTWDAPVIIAAQTLLAQTDFRNWDKANPPNYTLTSEGGAKSETLATVQNATYVYGNRTDAFPPATLTSCTLNITGLDAKAPGEISAFKDTPLAGTTKSNCTLGEWQVFGWPSATPPAPLKGHLKVTLHDLTTDSTSTLLDKEVTVNALSQSDFPIDVPTRKSFGQIRIDAEFKPDAGAETVSSNFPLLFVPDDSPHLLPRADLDAAGMGFLCSPGFCGLDPFGTGTNDDTQGWGGPDDKVWAWTHGLMETGDPRNQYLPQRFLLAPTGLNHYTDPWRDFPSGQYVWEWATERIIDAVTTGRFKGTKTFHAMLADRWNGIPIGSAFTWADFIRFDEYLKAAGKPGLKARTRGDLWKEIVAEHSDEFQRFELNRYADAMLDTQKKLAAIGVDFTSETHGSFPLAGGKLGEKLAATDVAVGTDLFWELKDEDVIKGIGYRFGVVAANPDLKSGAYDQWEWTSGTQQNPTWFSPSGDVEPSRLQWYNTYWKGRITSEGKYEPYTVYGFSMQGDYGTKNTMDDWTKFNRVQSTMIWVRPEQPTGVGIVASWQNQENHMAPNSTQMGFGLYASNGYNPSDPHDKSSGHDQVDAAVGEVYYRLVKNGVPISFVASTETLKKWNGNQPLVAVDGFETDPWEIAEFDRLNQAGAPIIAVGSEGSSGRTAAEALFGVTKSDSGWTAGKQTQVVNDDAGQPLAYVCERKGRAPTLFCPLPITSLNGPQSTILATWTQKLTGQSVTVPYGVATSPFVSNGSLFLALGNLGDTSRVLDITVRPSVLNAKFSGQSFRVIDHDRAMVVPSEWKDGALHFQIPAAPNDGRLIQLAPVAPTT